jgi:ribosomal protein S24E
MEQAQRIEEPTSLNVAHTTTSNKSTKEELITSIKEWIKLDNDIAKAKSDIKEKTARKKALTENLVVVMKSNSIDCFDINGGALIYKQKTTKKPISAKYLLAELQKIYKDQPDVASDLTKQLLDNRELTVKDEICRKINK